MELHQCFDFLAANISQAQIPSQFKSEILKTIEYFKIQSLCDLDRRDQPVVLRNRWRELEGKTKGLGLFDNIKKNDNLWRSVRCFVYDAEPATLLVPQFEKIQKSNDEKFEKWTPEDFFDHLLKGLSSVPRVTEQEATAVSNGLLFLIASASLPKMKRRHAEIKKVWKGIHPALNRLSLMIDFSKNKILRDKIKLFIEGTLY